MMGHWLTNFARTGENPVRMGTSNSLLFPLRVFATRTKAVFVAGTNDSFWRILCTALERHDWLNDARFATNDGRIAHRATLEPLIEAHFAAHTAEELLGRLIPAGMPCSAVERVGDLIDNPHVKARAALVELEYPGLGPVTAPVNPLRLSAAPAEVRRRSPEIGEHTLEILGELGYAASEIAALRAAKAVGIP